MRSIFQNEVAKLSPHKTGKKTSRNLLIYSEKNSQGARDIITYVFLVEGENVTNIILIECTYVRLDVRQCSPDINFVANVT